MGMIASQITSLMIVYSIVYSDADQRKHQSSASLAFVQGIHRGPVNSLHKWPVTRKMFPFDDVIMDTMQCRYNVVSFLWNPYKRHPIAYWLGWGMGCLLWVQILIDILLQSLQLCIQYSVILDRVITAPDCRSSIVVDTVNILRPRQKGCRFADDTFKRIFLNENVLILIKISLKFIPNGPVNNIPALIQIMAWRRPGDKPLSESMMVR